MKKGIKKMIVISEVVLQLFFGTQVAGAAENPAKNINNQIFPKNTQEQQIVTPRESSLDDLIRIWPPESVERMAIFSDYDLNTMNKSILYLNAFRFGVYGFPLAAVRCTLALDDEGKYKLNDKERYEIGALLLNQEQVGNSMKLFETLPKDSECNLLAICGLYSTENPLNALEIEKRVKENNQEYFDKEPSLDGIRLKSALNLVDEKKIGTAFKVSLMMGDEDKLITMEKFLETKNKRNAERLLGTIEDPKIYEAGMKKCLEYIRDNK